MGIKKFLATFRRKIDVSGIEVSWLPQNKTRRGERRARVGLALQLSFFEVGTLSGGLVSSAPE